jgi:hypothetical protein
MKRRDFLWTMSAAALASRTARGAQSSTTATVLYEGRAIALDRAASDGAGAGDALWIRKPDLTRVNDFEVKPEGACRADVCIPIPPVMVRDEFFDLTAFAERVGQRVVAAPTERVWSFSEIPVVRGAFLGNRVAPDFAVPDRKGRVTRLSQFRGKKVLVVTWASW